MVTHRQIITKSSHVQRSASLDIFQSIASNESAQRGQPVIVKQGLQQGQVSLDHLRLAGGLQPHHAPGDGMKRTLRKWNLGRCSAQVSAANCAICPISGGYRAGLK